MIKGLRVDKELTKDTDTFFGVKYYVVHYDLDPINPSSLNRLIVIDDVPGKVAQFFGRKTVRRYFVGRIDWYEILDKKIKCPMQMEARLSEISATLEKKYKHILKAKRLKRTAK